MKKIIIVPIIIGIIIIASTILLNSNEKTVEEEWKNQEVRSGPFLIDKSQYNLGEKIFISVTDLPRDEKGQMIFFRPIHNDDGLINYITMEFNGESKQQFNLYFEPQLSKMKKICTTNELVGTWVVKFIGTEYQDITFEILNQTSSWDERTFDPVC